MDASGGVCSLASLDPRHPSRKNGGAPRLSGRGSRGGDSNGGGPRRFGGLPEGGETAARSSSGGGSGLEVWGGVKAGVEMGGGRHKDRGDIRGSAFREAPAVKGNAFTSRMEGRGSSYCSGADGRAGITLAKTGETRLHPPTPPPIARPLPRGRLANGADRHGVEVVAAATAPLGLAQEWGPRGGARLAVGSHFAGSVGAGGRRGSGRSDAHVPSTVMFGNEWGRKREWRRSGYMDSDIDPLMTACRFEKPANSTGELKRTDLDDEGGRADLEEMDLVRRIKSFRERR